MREERKLNKAIKKDGIDTQSDILEELKRRYPQYDEQSEVKQAPARKRRFAFISALAAAAVCAAIVVPCAVFLPNGNNGVDNGGKDNNRYCTQDEYVIHDVEYTILEYRENNGCNFLYFNWYEIGEDFNTACYTSIVDNEVLCLQEQAYLPQSDELVQLSITKSNVYLSEFDIIIEGCVNKYSVDNHTAKWGIKKDNAYCILEYDGYRYFIRIEEGQDENRLFDLVTKLLETK
ncbi:MAG: hypothetical protein K2F90_05690 [Clostridiales bacterium]|nr:hypothetical protein [Clostridiales bacterium]